MCASFRFFFVGKCKEMGRNNLFTHPHTVFNIPCQLNVNSSTFRLWAIILKLQSEGLSNFNSNWIGQTWSDKYARMQATFDSIDNWIFSPQHDCVVVYSKTKTKSFRDRDSRQRPAADTYCSSHRSVPLFSVTRAEWMRTTKRENPKLVHKSFVRLVACRIVWAPHTQTHRPKHHCN